MPSIRHKSEVASPERPTVTSPDDNYLDAAREAILAVGWSRTTLTDIARRADLMTREWGDVVREATDSGEEATAAQRITGGAVATVRALRGNALLRRIIDVDPEMLLPYLLDRRGRSQDSLAGVLAALVAAGQRDGSVRTGDPDVIARSLVLACHGFALSAHTMTDGPAPARDADVTAYDAELALLVERFLAP
jgi:hypothetical protein